MPRPPRSVRSIDADFEFSTMRIRRAVGAGVMASAAGVGAACWAGFAEGAWPRAQALVVLAAVGLLLSFLTSKHWRSAAALLVAGYVAAGAWFTAASSIPWIVGYLFLLGLAAVSGALHAFRLPKLYREFLAVWTPREVRSGDVYTVRDGAGFAVVKVLAVDEARVHVRQYAMRYPARPWQVKTSTLARASAARGPGAFPHLPLGRSEFARWEPVLLRPEPLEAEELAALHAWRALHGPAAPAAPGA